LYPISEKGSLVCVFLHVWKNLCWRSFRIKFGENTKHTHTHTCMQSAARRRSCASVVEHGNSDGARRSPFLLRFASLSHIHRQTIHLQQQCSLFSNVPAAASSARCVSPHSAATVVVKFTVRDPFFFLTQVKNQPGKVKTRVITSGLKKKVPTSPEQRFGGRLGSSAGVQSASL